MGGYVSSFLCSIVGFAYPTYASFKALETEDKDDDTQWLTYWVVYSVFNVVESFTDFFVFWVPFYYEAKLMILLALQLPQLGIAPALYNNYVRPFFKKNEGKIDSFVDEASESAKKAAGDFVSRNSGKILEATMSAVSSANEDKTE